MMKPFAAVAIATLAASFAVSTPAKALTVLLGGPSESASAVYRSGGGVDFTFTAASFTGNPAALTSLANLVNPLLVSVTAPGLGVAGGASGPQIDTNQANRREALVLSASRAFEITGVKLSFIDSNDTFQLYGVNPDGTFVSLVNEGTIQSGLGGAASVVNTGANNGTSTLTFASPWGNFTQYVFTTRVAGNVLYNGDVGQGYRLDAISFNIVPEPQMWATMIAGFALTGLAVRRRRKPIVSA